MPRYARARQGGGFLAGAAQTAVGVAGGVLLGNALAGLFGGDAQAAEGDSGVHEGDDDVDADDYGADDGGDSGDFGGDMDI